MVHFFNNIPEPTVSYLLNRHAKWFSSSEALVFEGKRWNWEQLYYRANLAAKALQSHGIKASDRISIISENRSEFWELFLGCSLSGTVLCPINYRLIPEIKTVRYLLEDCGAKLLFIEEKYEEFIYQFVDELGIEEANIIIIERSFGTFLEKTEESVAPFQAESNSPLLMLHTSGTTGHPKWVVMTHSSFVWNGIAESHHIGIRPSDRILQAMPLVHTGGLCWMTSGAFVSGATLILVKKWDPEIMLKLIANEKCTKLWGQEAGLTKLIQFENIHKYDLRSLRSVFTAAGPNKRDWSLEVIHTLGLGQFQYTYGSTEAGLVSVTDSSSETLYKEGSVGRPVFTCDVKVCSLDGKEVRKGEIGELWVRSPAVFSGYHNHPKKTKRVFAGGWYHTGDIVRLDEHGMLYFINRMDDMIKTGGENVSPYEIENVLLKVNPEVKEAVVVGVDDKKWTQAVTAFVVCNSENLNENIVRDRMRKSIASYKIPKKVYFIDEIPRSDQGKVLRSELQHFAKNIISAE